MPQIPQFTDDLGFISRLGDNPNTDNGLSSQALKEEFDKAPKVIQQFINNYVIPALNNYIMGNNFLPTTGGHMTGAIVMQGNKITMLGAPVDAEDAVNKDYADKLFPNVVGIDRGGTGASTADEARTKLGAAATVHYHSYNDLQDKPSIPTIPSSLPANGGNADTVDGKHANDFADANHTQAMDKGGTGATSGQAGLENLLAAGYMVMSSYQIVSSVDAIPSDAPNGALFLVPMEE